MSVRKTPTPVTPDKEATVQPADTEISAPRAESQSVPECTLPNIDELAEFARRGVNAQHAVDALLPAPIAAVVADVQAGMDWWNALPASSRALWLARSGDASVAGAWKCYCAAMLRGER